MSPSLEQLRRAGSFAVVASFLAFIFYRVLAWRTEHLSLGLANSEQDILNGKHPDFSHWVLDGTLSEKELALGAGRRAIFVGDIHGQSIALQELLDKLEYDREKDTLIHVGDIVAKGTLSGSRLILAFMAERDIKGVRGNHDQKVVEWRAWREWVAPLEGGEGERWLERIDAEYDEKVKAQQAADEEAGIEELDEDDVDNMVEYSRSRKDKRWYKLVPQKWKLLGPHYQVARVMTPEQYIYLKNLPLRLHLPSEHTFVVHAGLLPYDPSRPMLADGQPLGHAPDTKIGDVVARRTAQERALLANVPQNNDPWSVTNMRNVLHDHTISKDTDRGKPWYGTWNTIMPKCMGFAPSAEHDVAHDRWMPCEPMTVVYGHAASRGLDIHRWTIGLDSGCVYGRRLTALVLDEAHEHRKMIHRRNKENQEEAKANKFKTVKFGDEGEGQLVSVTCHKHKDSKNGVAGDQESVR